MKTVSIILCAASVLCAAQAHAAESLGVFTPKEVEMNVPSGCSMSGGAGAGEKFWFDFQTAWVKWQGKIVTFQLAKESELKGATHYEFSSKDKTLQLTADVRERKVRRKEVLEISLKMQSGAKVIVEEKLTGSSGC